MFRGFIPPSPLSLPPYLPSSPPPPSSSSESALGGSSATTIQYFERTRIRCEALSSPEPAFPHSASQIEMVFFMATAAIHASML